MERLTLGSILLFFLCVSCEQDSISPSKLQVTEIEDAYGIQDLYTYEDGKLSVFERCGGYPGGTTINFYYSDGKVSKIESYLGQEIKRVAELTYNENGQRHQEKVTVIWNGDTTLFRTNNFSYTNGVLSSIMIEYKDYPYPEEREFFWVNGNLVRISTFHFWRGIRIYSYSRLFTYDTNPNYTNQDMAFIYLVGDGDETQVSRNNVLSIHMVWPDERYLEAEFTFAYNENGYPAQYIRKSGNGNEHPPTLIKYD